MMSMPTKSSSGYWSKPVYGRGFKPFTTTTVEITPDTVDQWKFKKLVHWKKVDYALFRNDKGEEVMQSLQAIRFIRLRPGEENYMSKLTDAQGLEIFKRANAGEDRNALAKEFGVSPDYVSDIKNVRARISITMNYLNGTEKKKAPAAKKVGHE